MRAATATRRLVTARPAACVTRSCASITGPPPQYIDGVASLKAAGKSYGAHITMHDQESKGKTDACPFLASEGSRLVQVRPPLRVLMCVCQHISVKC